MHCNHSIILNLHKCKMFRRAVLFDLCARAQHVDILSLHWLVCQLHQSCVERVDGAPWLWQVRRALGTPCRVMTVA